MTSSRLEIVAQAPVFSSRKHVSSLGIVAPVPVFSSRKPSLPATHRKRCIADRPVADVTDLEVVVIAVKEDRERIQWREREYMERRRDDEDDNSLDL
ncbi:hypothetical protein HanIR_Chr17g0884051 [Helianthus annuus]|nr:hypothetical protein HanIR_Chr17g0884051 [Helianthus annuus]